MPSVVVKAAIAALADTSQRIMARDSNGRLWVAYVRNDGTNDRIYVAYSDDDGLTWTEELVSVDDYNDAGPSIAIDSTNALHVIWHGNAATHRKGRYRKRSSDGSWSDRETMNKGLHEVEFAIAVDSQDDAHVVWRSSFDAYWNIYYTKQTAGVWGDVIGNGDIEAVTAVFSAPGTQSNPTIAIDSNDDVHVAWGGQGVGAVNDDVSNIHYRKREGGVWQAIEHVTDSASAQSPPTARIALDSAGDAHVIFSGTGWGVEIASGNIQYRKRESGVWQTQEAITDKDAHQYDCSVAINGSVHVVFSGLGWGSNPTKRSIQYRKRTTSWGTQQELVNRAYDQYQPNLCHALWPRVQGARVSRPKAGYCFLWRGQDASGFNAEYFYSDDLAWDTPARIAGLNPAAMELVLG